MISILTVMVLAVLGGVTLANTGDERQNDATADQGSLTTAEVVGSCGPSSSTQSDLAVVGIGAFHEPGSTSVWFGTIIENGGHKLAYHPSVTFTLWDENCDPLPDSSFDDSGNDSALRQTIPVIAGGGVQAGLGGHITLNTGSSDVRLGGVSVNLSETQWQDPDSADPGYLSDLADLGDTTLIPNGTRVDLDGTVWAGRNSSPSIGISLVYLDGQGRIVGGSTVIRAEVQDGSGTLAIGRNTVAASFDRPMIEHPPAGTEGLSVDVVDVKRTLAFGYPEYVDPDNDELISS